MTSRNYQRGVSLVGSGAGSKGQQRVVDRHGRRVHVTMKPIIEAGQVAAAGIALVEEIRRDRPDQLVIDLTGVTTLEERQLEAVIDLMTIAKVLSVEPSIEGMSAVLKRALRGALES